MPRPYEIAIAVPLDTVRRAIESRHEASRENDGALGFDLHSQISTDLRVRVTLQERDGATVATWRAQGPARLPYFQWFMGPIIGRLTRKAVTHAADSLAAELEGRPAPPAPKRSMLGPPVPYDHETGSVIATISAVAAVAGLGSTLFSANVDFITEAFDQTDRAVGVGSAVSRVGIVVALVAAGLADRIGRRRMLLVSVTGVCIASGLSAVAPTFETFIGAQLFTRGFVNGVFVVSGIIAVEEAPERARAYAIAMVTLAWGAGQAIGVVLLPLGDLGEQTWRLAYGVNAVMLIALPGFARHLPETTRYQQAAGRLVPRGRFRDLTIRAYRSRFIVVISAALLLNVMSAPSSQFANRFLGDERGFSGLKIAIYLSVVAGLPALIGLFAGGRLSEAVGRKPVAVYGTAFGTVATMAFYVSSGFPLWILGTADAVLVSMTVPAVRAFTIELFPTETRGTAAGAVLMTGLAGSAIGLVLAGALSDHMSLGGAIAWMGIAPLIAALVLMRMLPEPSHEELDVISPPLG